MKLIEYIEQEGHGSQTALAKMLSCTPVLISQWANGIRQVPLERCVDIELATLGRVSRADLRPDDWQRIWPELVVRTAASADQTEAP